jgi:hypothetical protein
MYTCAVTKIDNNTKQRSDIIVSGTWSKYSTDDAPLWYFKLSEDIRDDLKTSKLDIDQNYLNYISNEIHGWYSVTGGVYKSSSSVRPPRSSLKNRTDKLDEARQYILKYFGKYCRIGVELNFISKEEAIEALKEFPSINLEMFFRAGYTAIAILKLYDSTIIDSLLQKDWLVKLDTSMLSFGKLDSY